MWRWGWIADLGIQLAILFSGIHVVKIYSAIVSII
jgi:hypothetical protein